MGINLPGESDAAACHRMGWTVGTRIVGDEGLGPEIWRITAIGIASVLTVTEKPGGDKREKPSSLSHRDWRKVGAKEVQSDE